MLHADVFGYRNIGHFGSKYRSGRIKRTFTIYSVILYLWDKWRGNDRLDDNVALPSSWNQIMMYAALYGWKHYP